MSSKATNHDGVLKEYLKEIESSLKHGHATEHTYRPALKTLLESITKSNVQAINEPKQIECGAPDFIVIQGTIPLGYVEAKDLGLDLDAIQDDEQISRYRESLANFILTDYLEFRWYLDGELRLTASLPRPSRTGRIHWDDDSASQVAQLLRQFIQADIPLKATPKDLATRMAGLARLIRELIEQTFKAEEEKGELHVQLQAFRKVLIDSLTKEQFADMYAQTLCYGLFAARCNSRAKGFTRQIAANALPKTNPFLRKLFNSIAGPDLDPRIAWAVDQLADMLARADIDAILESFGRKTRQEDPVVHFYETFLASYDQKLREARGVYYTPEPVVGYIVRSIDSLLKKQFKLPEGLAHAGKIKIARKKSQGKGSETIETHKLQILDPATGTGTFLYAVIEKIKEHFKGNKGAWPGYVAEHLLPRLFGFEILMAPYAVAHMKLGLELEQTGYDFSSNQRLGVYLTNSLEEAHELTGLPLFTQWLAEESHAASAIKRDAPVMVVLGNPPYSGHSSNKGPWIEEGPLKDGKNAIGLITLEEISNTKATLYITELYLTCLLNYAKDSQGKSPRVLVVVEEAHTVMPEPTTMGLGDNDSKGLVSKIAQIALQGRKYRVGLLVIAQRTATVSKSVLTQCNTMITFTCFDETSLGFLSNIFSDRHKKLIPNLPRLQALVFGKALRSEQPIVIQIPHDPKKEGA